MVEIRGKGRRGDQKMKPYLVYDYLMRNSDENHVVSANEICGYLEEMGISAERRSIYKDIEEINKAILLIDAAAEDVYLSRFLPCPFTVRMPSSVVAVIRSRSA